MTALRSLDVLGSLAALALLLSASGCGKSGQEYAANVGETIDRGKAMSVRGDMQKVAAAVTSYVTQQADLPPLSDIHALAGVLEPSYARRVPREDPWGTEYRFESSGSGYRMHSAGQDRAWDSDDDIVMEDGQMTQLPKGFQRP